MRVAVADGATNCAAHPSTFVKLSTPWLFVALKLSVPTVVRTDALITCWPLAYFVVAVPAVKFDVKSAVLIDSCTMLALAAEPAYVCSAAGSPQLLPAASQM